MGGGSEARSNAEDSRSAFDELSFPIGVRRFDSCPPHHHHLNCANFYMKSWYIVLLWHLIDRFSFRQSTLSPS
jgi:hypothetical protein